MTPLAGARAAVVVPIKAFAGAKARLSEVLEPERRVELAKTLALRVFDAARPLPIVAVCDDDDVAAFARFYGARALLTPGLGLSGAVRAGVVWLRGEGVTTAVVAHADLGLARPGSLARLAEERGATPPAAEVLVVPDRRLAGTNVIVVASDADFHFSYGPGSFARHVVEARRVSARASVRFDWRLSVDVDLPSDLQLLGAW